MALAAGIAPRSLQELLLQHRWDEDSLRRRLHEVAIRDHAGLKSIRRIDATSDVEKTFVE